MILYHPWAVPVKILYLRSNDMKTRRLAVKYEDYIYDPQENVLIAGKFRSRVDEYCESPIFLNKIRFFYWIEPAVSLLLSAALEPTSNLLPAWASRKPNTSILSLKMPTSVFAEKGYNFQHSTCLIPESRSCKFYIFNNNSIVCLSSMLYEIRFCFSRWVS